MVSMDMVVPRPASLKVATRLPLLSTLALAEMKWGLAANAAPAVSHSMNATILRLIATRRIVDLLRALEHNTRLPGGHRRQIGLPYPLYALQGTRTTSNSNYEQLTP